MTYATRDDMENVYGRENVRKWADIENTGDSDYVAQRVSWALSRSDSIINDMMKNGPYTIPFESPYPDAVVYFAAVQAGIVLYDARGLSEAEPENDNLAMHRKAFMGFIYGLRNGSRRLTEVDPEYDKWHPEIV